MTSIETIKQAIRSSTINKNLRFQNSYFFLAREVNYIVRSNSDFDRLKNDGLIRHCKPNKYSSGFYDYIVNENYNTLEEWLDSCVVEPGERKPTMAHVMYGIYRWDRKTQTFDDNYVSLKSLMDDLPPPANKVESILTSQNMTLSHLWVQFGSMFLSWDRFKELVMRGQTT